MIGLWGVDLVPVSAAVVSMMITLGILLALLRLIRGPSLPDRVVALDLIATLSVGAIAVHSIASNEPIYLLVATVLALITFLGTVAFTSYVAKGRAE